jgi:hypothetical protein
MEVAFELWEDEPAMPWWLAREYMIRMGNLSFLFDSQPYLASIKTHPSRNGIWRRCKDEEIEWGGKTTWTPRTCRSEVLACVLRLTSEMESDDSCRSYDLKIRRSRLKEISALRLRQFKHHDWCLWTWEIDVISSAILIPAMLPSAKSSLHPSQPGWLGGPKVRPYLGKAQTRLFS